MILLTPRGDVNQKQGGKPRLGNAFSEVFNPESPQKNPFDKHWHFSDMNAPVHKFRHHFN